MTPGLVLLFPSLMFRANSYVNAQEQVWKSPAPGLGGVWERWVSTWGTALTPLPLPPGPSGTQLGRERGPSCKS